LESIEFQSFQQNSEFDASIYKIQERVVLKPFEKPVADISFMEALTGNIN